MVITITSPIIANNNYNNNYSFNYISSISEILTVPRKEENADKRTSNKKVSIGKRRKKEKTERHKAHQNMLIFDKRKRYLSKKVIETKSTTNQKGKELKNQCPKWKYERENWTIVYHASHAEYNRTLCPKPSNGKIIKRILFNDGTFLNTGCNKNTRDCKEYPFYDFKDGVRINTPPCCRHHVLTMFDHVTIELKRQGVSHSMISGGVIGLVRNKRMIPYDRDLDLIIEIDYWNTTEFWKMFQRLHEKYGYVADDVEEFKVKLYLSKLNRNNIDIWAYWAENDTVSIAFHGFKKQSMKTMMPFKAVRFEWFSTFAPAKPIQYLDRQYGKEVWRPEKQCMVRNAEGDCW